MEIFQQFMDLFLHLDKHLQEYVTVLGPWLYLVLFAIIFCETGLVVTPFLPGDSLLFAVGAVAALPGVGLSLPLLVLLLIAAAVAGDAVNYSVGHRLGPKVFKYESSRLFNVKHLQRAQHFYEKYGGKTIILARFIPIIRTFAPFVAGIGKMQYTRFALYNVTGGAAWVVVCLGSGYLLGNVPWVKEHFGVIVLAIIFISLLPPVIEFLLQRRKAAVKEPVAVPVED
jgi:membrane-associated protein